MSLRTFLLLRLLLAAPTALAVLGLTFAVARLAPGDPTVEILGEQASPAAREALRRELGLAGPLPAQYAAYVGRALRGDFGASLITRRPAMAEVLRALPPSLALAAAGLGLAGALGVAGGVAAAVRPRGWPAWAADALSVAGAALPPFWVAQAALLLFAHRLRLFPALGAGATGDLVAQAHALALPAAVLGLSACAPIVRLTRAAMRDALRQPFVLAARGRGLSERSVRYRHALRAALLPVLGGVGGLLGWAIGNAVLVEAVFARPGLGSLLANAALSRDYPVLQAGLALIALVVAALNAGMELIYRLADPRLR